MNSPALKEWGAAVQALLAGRQTVLLRKGGIHEKRFELSAPEFVFFPTVAHSHAERVRPEFSDLLERAAGDSTEIEVVLRGGAKVLAAVAVERPERLEDIADLHIWTADSVQNERVDFRPRHRLTVLVVQAKPLAAPVWLARTPDYAGCRSWVDLPVTADWGLPVYDDAALASIAQRVRDSVG
ncbi:DUF1802 family protein [Mycobacterium sp. CBMA293]|uniref:DUF1802 family protein n=1 Tax=unclassified Mycolicibacterium TaxID=2636767 RepID=UPI00132574D1|nr:MULTISPECIES: DUF1802 family protein [unclassified Mycolicibacterium]MUL44935.1 DUF1802 family protein [Mycolicibacterium sp. CBMA 360]MUL95528.1 DUF1802 family protein [Mycolicibacterium sp. CBMA 230]MUM35891.1 DUF1802 family protein [Mycolicibacterium sp. CBMA 361]MUL57956.1 DUF1802 family protein [Mycolicibacterium sp. CBMA 335]MUL73414.1 DUF1802 family protein [Mycolicibacterium sp. CBMA 311]